ncbi:KLRBC protein, partial [Pitta sordida]|nr:KLRBC protein [Pitta sordida]
CPWDWIWHRGGCYHLSKDWRTWEQSQDRCSELGASLAVLSDEMIKFFYHFSAKEDFWIGLRR